MNDELTSRVSRQLHDQVDDWQTTPLSLDDVRGRARTIRRTRRVVAGAAVAAVFAIATPLALVAGGAFDASPDRELPPATDSPSEGVDTDNPVPDGSGVGVPVLSGRTLTMPDGTRTTLPRGYDSVQRLGDQVLGVWVDTDTGRATLDRIEDGEVVDSTTVTDFSLVPNAEGTAVAYVRADGEVVVQAAGGASFVGNQPGARPVALVGGPDCGTAGQECTVYLERGSGAPVVLDGSDVRDLPGDLLALQDVAPDGRVAGLASVDELAPSSCSRVVRDGGEGATVFETCEVSLLRFSPDGAHLSATDAYRSGSGPSQTVIVDGTTGGQVARFAPDNGFLNTFVWEDADHLLTVAYDYDDRAWSVVRLGVDGSVETVLGPVEGGQRRPAFRLLGAS